MERQPKRYNTRGKEHYPSPLGKLLDKYDVSLSRVEGWLRERGVASIADSLPVCSNTLSARSTFQKPRSITTFRQFSQQENINP